MSILNIFRVNYNTWMPGAIDKIIKCVDTSITVEQFKTCKRMINQFILISITNSDFNADEIQRIADLLNTYLNTKKV